MRKDKLLRRLHASPANIRFSDLCWLAEACGFESRGGKGSHRVYSHPGIRSIVNIQDVDGQAKPYQVRQLLRLIEEHGL